MSKVPEITLGFWILKVLATTLGETAGDAVSMSMQLGYLAASAVFAGAFVAAVAAQVSSTSFRPALYWVTIVATTTMGTTLADFADRSLGIGYAGGSLLLIAGLLLSLAAWRAATGSISVRDIATRRSEAFYWGTIMLSQTLGTALGDWTADSMGLGYAGGAVVFGALLLAAAVLYRWTRISRTALFWAAFVLTRPLGAVVGDFLDKPAAKGGLELSRYSASAALIVLIVMGLVLIPQRQARGT